MASTGSSSSVQAADAPAPAVSTLVALASCNNERTIQSVAEHVRSFAAHAGSSRSHVLLADAGSTDHSLEIARSTLEGVPFVELDAASRDLRRVPPLRAALRAAVDAGADCIAVVDAGIVVEEPHRLERLIAPVAGNGFDYAEPFYTRHRYDGALTKAIVHPVFRALYGAPVRQPAGSEFCCSRTLVEHFLAQDFWEHELAESGIHLWLTSEAALTRSARLCDVGLGQRLPTPAEQLPDLSTALAEVVGSLFVDVEARVDAWHRVRGIARPLPLTGDVDAAEPDPPAPGLDRLLEVFRLGERELREIWTWILPPSTLVELRRAAQAPAESFRIDDDLWARIVYDFAFSQAQRILPRDHLLQSLVPLYSGWMASFVLQVDGRPAADVDERLERVAAAFERERRYLIARWRWPERLRR